MAVYPGAIPDIPASGWTHDQVAQEIEAIAGELGIDPSSPATTVAERLTVTHEIKMRPRFRAGFWYSTQYAVLATGVPSQDALRCSPFHVPDTQAFDRIACEITTAVAGSTVRLGIYTDDGAGYPANLVLDAGTALSDTTGGKEIVASFTLNPGVYWLTYKAEGGAPTTRILNSQGFAVAYRAVNDNANLTGWNHSSAPTGAFPATFPTKGGGTFYATTVPKIAVRAA